MSVAKRGYVTKSYLAEAIQYILYRLKNGLAVAHNEEKVKSVSLCFLCSYVKSGRVYANTREKNVFVKPDEQRRACSNIVMARIGNRRHGALSEVERQNALFKELEKNEIGWP